MTRPNVDSDAHERSPAEPPAPWNSVARWFSFVLRDPERGLQRLGMMESFYNQRSPWHHHGNVQALVVVEGSIIVEFAKFPPVVLQPADAMVIPAEVDHRAGPNGEERRMVGIELRLAPLPPNDLYRYLVVEGQPRTWRCHRLTFLRSLAELRRLANRGVETPGPELIRAVWGLCVTEGDVAQPLPHSTDDTRPADEGHDEQAIDRRVLYVERQMRSFMHLPYRAEALAASIQVSTSQMNRLFNQHRGKSPLRRLQEIRLEQAMQYLTYSTLSIKQIADRCGFAGADHFARVFRQQTHQAPREYRAEHQPSASRPR